MTSDGVSGRDWNLVRRLATDIVNSTGGKDTLPPPRHIQKMHSLLGRLSRKYGDRPSLIATKADYTDDVSAKLKLLLRAYALAGKLDDKKNLTLVSSSIAETYIEELKDAQCGKRWLDKLLRHLDEHWDVGEAREHSRLKRVIQRLPATRMAPRSR